MEGLGISGKQGSDAFYKYMSYTNVVFSPVSFFIDSISLLDLFYM